MTHQPGPPNDEPLDRARPQFVAVVMLLAALAAHVTACSDPPIRAEVAFVGVNVISMQEEEVLEDQTVLVVGDEIVAIGSADEVRPASGALVIHGQGGYLMPGLSDMHVHLVSASDFWLFLANGVTTVRNMSGRSTVVSWRDSIAHGQRIGPTIFTAGPLVDGPNPIWPGSAVVDGGAAADSVVARQHDEGYDFVKVYDGLSELSYASVLGAAQRRSLPTAGHIPPPVGVHRALELGQTSIEHLYGYAAASHREQPPIPLDTPGLQGSELQDRRNEIGAALLAGRVAIEDLIDPRRLAKAAEATAAAGTYNTPTLWVKNRLTLSGSALQAAMAETGWAYLLPAVRSSWPSLASRPEDPSPERAAYLRYAREVDARVVRALQAAGAPLLLGTDTPNPFVFPGFSIHGELRTLVEAGLSPFDALRAGTVNAAAFLGEAGVFGTVRVGARADLLLLEGNPLKDLTTLRAPVGVMVRGNWLPRHRLVARLAEIEARNAMAP